ncbi:hypothetical protein TNCV_1599751 [Trichonephila clavipes]|nr:hypothetical protein TNCV_1599751 [Trichonephila clavipes]
MRKRCQSSRADVTFRRRLQFFELFGARRSNAHKLASLWNCSAVHELLLCDKKNSPFRRPEILPVQTPEDIPESSKVLKILGALDLPTPTTVAISLTFIKSCSLRAIILERFFGVISISEQAKVTRVTWNKKL